jgi:hypothetical protein
MPALNVLQCSQGLCSIAIHHEHTQPAVCGCTVIMNQLCFNFKLNRCRGSAHVLAYLWVGVGGGGRGVRVCVLSVQSCWNSLKWLLLYTFAATLCFS